MTTKAKSPTKKATATKKPAARKQTARKAKSTANRVDYYPNRVPFLAAVTGVSFLMVLALLVTL